MTKTIASPDFIVRWDDNEAIWARDTVFYTQKTFSHGNEKTRSYCELNTPSMSASIKPPISVPSELLRIFTTFT